MNVMINDGLVSPPSSVISFRELTLFIKIHLQAPVLIEVENEFVDDCYYWLKRLGGMDFVDDFVRPGIEEGCRIDTKNRFPNTIKTDCIKSDNIEIIMKGVRYYFGIM